MNDAYLINMANQIGTFFTPYTDEEAVKGIAEHIQSFWDPRMRAEALALVKAGGEGFTPLVLHALKELAQSS